ncbi:MAG TPA: DNA-processing protein DprA [Longimicrobiales bacterium]|nr:DNA-processing protein DprA [Longimicrobiales bacterium]
MDSLSRDDDQLREARALLALEQLPGVGLVGLRTIVSAFGSAEVALQASRSEFRAVAGPAAERAREHDSWRDAVEAGLLEARRLGMAVHTWTSPGYPAALRHLHDPPPVLFLRGRCELLERPAVTVVGARRATGRGRDVAERLGRGLAQGGVCVVSGLALGIDGAAHRGALQGGGHTIAVLGRGADAPYPASHRRLFRDILAHGLVVSEFMPGTPPLPHHFPRRNRLLAGLSQAVIVVEAGARSGTLITVDHALDLGIDVWAVPGPLDSDACVGSNRLLGEGARPLVSVSDFLREMVGEEPVALDEATAAPPGAGRLLAGLGSETLGLDELASRAGVTIPTALALLAQMELRGLVKQLPGMRFRRAA